MVWEYVKYKKKYIMFAPQLLCENTFHLTEVIG